MFGQWNRKGLFYCQLENDGSSQTINTVNSANTQRIKICGHKNAKSSLQCAQEITVARTSRILIAAARVHWREYKRTFGSERNFAAVRSRDRQFPSIIYERQRYFPRP